MGYSNIAGALNVFTSTSTRTLTVREDTTLTGNLTAMNGLHSLGNVSVGNLVVTGNFTITATNTQVTNALSINNFGTASALKVVQYEGGGPGHSWNVAEFWDFQTLAMVIDPEGNVGIHTTSSPGYALTVSQGAYFDSLTTAQFNGPVLVTSLVGALAPAQLQAIQTNVTQVGTLTGLYSSGNVTAAFFSGQGNALTNVQSSVLVGNVALANAATSVTSPVQANITQVGTLTGLYSSGNVTAAFFSGQGNALTNVQSSVLVGNVALANAAVSVTNPAQANITSLGILTSLTINGLLVGSNASGLSNVNGANVSTVPTAQSVTVAAQTNITSLGTLTGLNVQGLLIGSNASALANLNASNVTSGTMSGARVYGNTLSNLNASNVAFGTVPNLSVANTLTVTNIVAAGFTSNATNTVFSFDTLTVPYVYCTTLNVSGSSNLILSTATQPNVTSLGTLTSLTVSGNSNLQTLNVASIATPTPVPASSGLFMNLNATYSLNSTGNWTGNIAGSVTSNLYTLFAPNPVASWTTYGSNPIITGPTANGGFRFTQTGPYQFTVVLTSDNNIKTIALSSNTSDIHSNLANPGVWLYCYRISVGQDPSVPVQIPFYVDSTSKYYYIDFEAMRQTDNIHKTAYTNLTAEGYTGSYVTLRPL